jgi:TRAP-type C4-dicarboxylate transport system permease small subunit
MNQRSGRYRLDHLLAALMMGGMALVAFVNVLGRYLFHYSLSFTEELTIHLFVGVVVVGAGIAFERGAHLGMVTFYRLFPVALRKGIIVFGAVLAVLLFLAVDVLLGISIYQEVTLFHARSASLEIPVWIYYAAVIVLSVFVFRGIWRGARCALRDVSSE